MWCASLDSPAPRQAGVPGEGADVSSAKPPASPIDKPLRPASAGRQMSVDTSCSALKPYKVVRQRLSTPPTTAASQKPAAIARAADANTLALDAHAAATATVTPANP